jgi:hypothetical protein
MFADTAYSNLFEGQIVIDVRISDAGSAVSLPAGT